MARHTQRWAAAVLMCGVGAAALLAAQRQAPRPTGDASRAAYIVLDLQTAKVVAQARPDVLSATMAPGSVIKIATLVAALEQHVIDGRTTVMCRRTTKADGHTLTCVHPDLHRGLTPAEALAYSCNTFFASVASRVSRSALDAVLVRMGLPPLAPQATVIAGGLGLDGFLVAPRTLLDAFVRVAGPGTPLRLTDPVRTVVQDGLRKAATFGTASAFGRAQITALAKTGTAPMPGGGFLGTVVAVTPADQPTHAIVVVVPGGAGADAAAEAVDILRRHGVVGRERSNAPAVVQVGIARRGGGYDREVLPLETYVSRVVAGEAVAGARPAALEALAIAARTYAMVNRSRHAAEGFDLCDLTHCQVMGRADAASDRAAQGTRGLVLKDGPRLATVFFSSSCGGQTELPSHAWGGSRDPAYLPAQPDPACGGEPAWTNEMSEPQARLVLAAAGMRGSGVRSLTIASRHPSGRVASLRVEGFIPEQLDAGVFLRASGQTLGWQVLKSTLFDIRRSSTGFVFVGRGLGHGVGLCVRGATRRAADGASREAILNAYFPGLSVGAADSARQSASAARVRVQMPEAEREYAGDVRDVAALAVDAFSARLGVTPPPTVELVFYPTVEAFSRGTGMPWWVSARTVGSRVDLQPYGALSKRGVLESTIRHEIVHVLADDVLRGKPAWVREGLAMVVSGEYRSAGTRPPGGCPTDAQLRDSRAPDEWRRWYDAAGGCVAAALASGQPWKDVR